MDYIGGAQVGQWLAAEPDVIKIASAICFAQCFVKADDVVIERANGTFRVMRLATATPASASNGDMSFGFASNMQSDMA